MAHIRARIYLRGFVGMMQKKIEATVWGLGLTRHYPKNSLPWELYYRRYIEKWVCVNGFRKIAFKHAKQYALTKTRTSTYALKSGKP